MIVKREIWEYADHGKVWVGKYRNSHNLPHWHSDCELLYVEHGNIDIFCDGKKYRLGEGGILYADSGKVHSMQAASRDTVLIVIIFDPAILRPYIGEEELASPVPKHAYPIPAVYKDLRRILLSKAPFAGGEAAGIVISLMSKIYGAEERVPRSRANETTQRFMELLGDIAEKFDEYTFQNAASFMGMSEAYFSRYFHRASGTTFSEYLAHVRIQNAISMLHAKNGHTMTEISELCGFGSIRNFNRTFKRLTGYPPSDIPRDFEMGDRFVYPSEHAFDPTLHDCELIESGVS